MECIICNKKFTPANSRQKTCSMACRMEKQRRNFAEYYRRINPLEEKMCEGCGKTFMPKRTNQKYCTPECRGLDNKKVTARKPSGNKSGQQSHLRPEVQQSGRIAEINRMARKQGLTYGELVGKMYAGQVKINR